MKVQWESIIPAVTTKFKKDDTLDFKMLRTDIGAQLEVG